jgi:IS4 transposase
VPDLLPGVLYVVDRNFVDFGFIAAVLEKPCDLVLRVRDDSPKMRTVRELPVSARDAEAGVVEDRRVILTGESRGKGGKRGRAAPTEELRCVTIRTTGRDGKETHLRLLTTLGEEVAGWTIGEIYRMRWQIELFFKWLKTWARMDHLLSTSRQGITFQFYVAVIAVLMMYVQSGQRVSIYALSVLGSVARGTMKLEQALEVIARRARERELERARQARLRARKKLG